MTKYKICQVMAREEGWGIIGAIPTIRNNPLDLRHSPHSQHPGDPNAIGTIDTIEDGWADDDRQVEMWAARGLTIADAIWLEAPPDVDGNHTAQYLAFVCEQMGMGQDTKMADALLVPADPHYSFS